MSRRRYISTDISIDRAIGKLVEQYGSDAALLYTWMIPHADDEGKLTGDPYEILSLVWSSLRSKTEDDVLRCLGQLSEFDLIIWDEEAKLVYFPVKSFYKYQSYIKPQNRRNVDPEPVQLFAAKSAENAGNNISAAKSAENSGENIFPATSAENAASFSFPPSFSPSVLEVSGSAPSGSDPSTSPPASGDATAAMDGTPSDGPVPNGQRGTIDNPTNQGVIRELVAEYRKVIPVDLAKQSDWSYMGSVYNQCGTDAVITGIAALRIAFTDGKAVTNPLAYVGTVAHKSADGLRPQAAQGNGHGPRDRPGQTTYDKNMALIQRLHAEAEVLDRQEERRS